MEQILDYGSNQPKQRIEIKLVNLTEYPEDKENYGYAYCPCNEKYEAIRITKPYYSGWVEFRCPKCNINMVVTLKGKYDEYEREKNIK